MSLAKIAAAAYRIAATGALAVLPQPAASPPIAPASPPPVRSHTAVVADGSFDYDGATRRDGYVEALDGAVDLALAPDASTQAAFARAHVPVVASLRVNRCTGTRGAAAYGYADSDGADAQATPDCSKREHWPPSAFYQSDGAVLFEPVDGGGPFAVLGNPAATPFRRAVRSVMTAAVATAGASAIALRGVASPAELGVACVAGGGSRARLDCSNTEDVVAAGGAGAWLGGMTALVRAAPRPVYLDGLQAFDDRPDVRHAPVAAVADLAAVVNVAGAICEDCFARADMPHLALRLRSAMRYVAQHKRVIVYDAGPRSARGEPTPPEDRILALAATALFYDYDATYFAAASCGRRTGIAVCPETAIVFARPQTTATDPEQLRDRGGNYRRTFAACSISGVDYGACVAIVNPKAYATLADGIAPGAPGFALIPAGFAFPIEGEVAGALRFRAFDGAQIDAVSGRIRMPPQSGLVVFAGTRGFTLAHR